MSREIQNRETSSSKKGHLNVSDKKSLKKSTETNVYVFSSVVSLAERVKAGQRFFLAIFLDLFLIIFVRAF